VFDQLNKLCTKRITKNVNTISFIPTKNTSASNHEHVSHILDLCHLDRAPQCRGSDCKEGDEYDRRFKQLPDPPLEIFPRGDCASRIEIVRATIETAIGRIQPTAALLVVLELFALICIVSPVRVPRVEIGINGTWSGRGDIEAENEEREREGEKPMKAVFAPEDEGYVNKKETDRNADAAAEQSFGVHDRMGYDPRIIEI
jgi:hypothetical protein